MYNHGARRALDEVRAINDPWDRVSAAHDLTNQLSEEASEASRLRRDAIAELDQAGIAPHTIARHIGLTRSRISAILKQGPQAERALFSPNGGAVTIALGSKYSEQSGAPADMISRDATDAYETLATAMRDFGLSYSREIVPSPGLLDLNRPNLVVLGSPKVLPTVGQIVASDPHLNFVDDGAGRSILHRDTGDMYRSPQDQGNSADYAYIGRLPRPDAGGRFLYLAGLHAAGTHGAARHLVDHAEAIHRAAKNSLFSQLIRVTYADRERRITQTEELTPLYTW